MPSPTTLTKLWIALALAGSTLAEPRTFDNHDLTFALTPNEVRAFTGIMYFVPTNLFPLYSPEENRDGLASGP